MEEINLSKNKYDTISADKRQNLLRLVMDQGQTIKDAAQLLSVNYSSARTIINKFKRHNTILPLPKGGKVKSVLTPEIIHEIEEIVSRNPQYSLKEIKAALVSRRQSNLIFDIS